jgi:hypothetical protein
MVPVTPIRYKKLFRNKLYAWNRLFTRRKITEKPLRQAASVNCQAPIWDRDRQMGSD